mgnify:CR=1 FL=1
MGAYADSRNGNRLSDLSDNELPGRFVFVPVVPLLLAAAISFVVCIAIPVVTWKVLERQGTVVERIKGVE